MLDYITARSSWVRRTFLALVDSIAVIVAVWASFAVRLGDWWPYMLQRAAELFILALLISLPVFYSVGLYRSLVLYAGRDVLYNIAKGVSFSLLLVIACWVLWQGAPVPRSAWFIYWLVLVTMLGGSRLLLRDYLRSRFWVSAHGRRVIIYGAGVAGAQLVTALQQDPLFAPIAFVDDNPDLQGNVIAGVKIYPPSRLVQLMQDARVETILLAVPSASRRRRRELLHELAAIPAQVLIMPNMTELVNGTRQIDELREVDIEDILGRDPIASDTTLLSANIRNKVVMITGAGGSIGSELCRQILQQQPRRLVLLELSEYGLYNIERELQGLLAKSRRCDHPLTPEIIPILGSANHRNRVQAIMETFNIETVYHAAAYKHVPIVEHNPIEGVQNNIFGTLYCAQAAIAAKVETFVLISTDKAVRPTNVMGATKRFAELVLQSLAQQNHHQTRFCMVRFGNVLASSGSVVLLFREQIRQGGPVTVTHPDAVRYFMTIPEAAQLVIQAGSMAEGGDVFLLDMGEPVNITQLAQRMIELSGFDLRDKNNPEGDIEILYTGLRSGEKLCEELLISGNDLPTSHPGIKRAREEGLSWAEIQTFLNRLEQASREFNYYEVRAVLLEAISGYQPDGGIEDWLWVARSPNVA